MPLIEPTILAAFGAMLCWGVGDFLIQHSTRKIGNLESLAFIEFAKKVQRVELRANS